MAKNKKIRTPIPAEMQAQAMAEAGTRCCMPRCANNSELVIHHIDGNPSKHDIGNLLVLCGPCHALVTRGEIDRKSCRMIKQEVSIRNAPVDELESIKEDIIFAMRQLVGAQDIACPIDVEDKGTCVSDLRIDAAAGQAIAMEKAGLHVPIGVLRALEMALFDSGECNAALSIHTLFGDSEEATATDHHNLGVLLHETGRADQAEQAFRKAIDTDSDDAAAWYNLGVHLGKTDRKSEAEEAFRKAIAAEPKNLDWRNNFAYVLWENGQADQAEIEAQEAIKIDPDHCYSNATLGLLQFEKDDLDAGLASYRHAMKTCPDDLDLRQKFHYEHGRVLARAARADDARQEFRAALKVDSKFLDKDQIEAELAKLA